ncbi:MAG: RcpC/CpaB family pilus assembly protein [Maledivibacter sp.]|nr:RcpC/CpaB family pilus assembly protein [Maledivibacter sp.]
MKLKGSFKNILISIMFLIIAVAAASYIYIGSAKTRKIVKIPVLRNNIGIGQQIKESDIVNKEIGEFKLDKDIVKSKDELIGKYALMEIFQGRYLYKDDISSIKPATKVNEKIKYGALAVTTDLNKCVGGIPGDGDYVKINIIRKKDSNNEMEIIQYKELSRVKILAIENSYGNFIKTEAQPENGLASGSNQVKPATVVFDAKPDQEKRLLEGEYSGDIHLVPLPLAMQSEDGETNGQTGITNTTEKETKDSEMKKEVAKDQQEDKEILKSNKEVNKQESTGFKVN